MASRLNPYISYNGRAREAMEFYQGIFGGELTITTFGDFGHKGMPMEDQVMHALLETPAGFTLMAADLPPDMPHSPGTNISISLSGDDEQELHAYWDGLCSEGVVTMALQRQAWGDSFGMCVDRYGIAWMVNISTPGGEGDS